MGLRDFISALTMGAVGDKTQLTAVPIEGHFAYLATGTTHRQEALKRIGTGKRTFGLIAEIGNGYDPEAVMVQAVASDGTLFHVGYISSKAAEKVVLHKLGRLMREKGKFLTVEGEIMPGDMGLIAQLNMPHISELRRLLGEYDGSLAVALAPKPISDSQAKARAELLASPNKFMAADLQNRVYSSGGDYIVKPYPEDLKNATDFAKKNASEFAAWEGVAYLVPEQDGQVAVQIDGVTIDHLEKSSAKLLQGRIDKPTPVRCTVELIVGRNRTWPHVQLSKTRKFHDA